MDKVYICLITEDVKYDNQGTILGVYEDYGMASKERDDFNEKYNYMIADVIESMIIKKIKS